MSNRSAAPKPTTYVALLRGINVGGKNVLPMKALAETFGAVGCSRVRTYVQSGNVVFDSSEPRPGLAASLSRHIADRHGLQVPVVLRTAQELAAIARGCPFADPGGEKPALHVVFLADVPTAKAAASLDPARSPPDRFVLVGREIYLFCPNGLGTSKLTNAYFDAKLATVSTARNMRTVAALVELSQR